MNLLIDADILLYKFAHRNEDTFEWDERTVSITSDFKTAVEELNEFVTDMREYLKADQMIMVFTGGNNFRYKVDSTYKHNRVKQPSELRPLLREYILENYEYRVFDSLEGDDTMGIIATMFKGQYIICSIDKDLKQIPCQHFNWDKEELVEVTPEEGERFFMRQILTGDPTDGYPGCPGVGLVAADQFLDDPYLLVPYEHVFKRGKRKGETEIRYTKEPTDNLWAGIVSLYESKGLTEEDAIRQARLAKILQVSDFNFVTEEPILWQPKKEVLV